MSFPRYEQYKDSGVEWLGEVPAGWGVKPLKWLASINDEALPETTDPAEQIEYVDIGSVTQRHGIERTEVVSFESAPSRARRKVRDGDVIVSTVRTYLKAIAPIKNPPPELVVSTGFAVIRPKGDFASVYACYALQTEYFMDEVIARSVGVSYPAINASDMISIYLPTPPLPEQHAIAAFLDRETAKIDALIAEQQRLIALLAEKRQAVISHAVTKGLNPDAPMKDSGVEWLGEVPAHWEVTRLANLFQEVDERGSDELPVLCVSIHNGISDRELNEEEMDRKVSRSEDRSIYKQVMAGDLVYNMMRAWQGAFGAAKVSGMVSPAYVVARPRRPLVTTYIELLLRTPQAIEQMRRHSKGVTDFRLRLYWDEFKDIRVAVPPYMEEESICAHVEELVSEYETLSIASQQTITLLQERRTALISAAVTGKIDVRGLAPQEAA